MCAPMNANNEDHIKKWELDLVLLSLHHSKKWERRVGSLRSAVD